MSEPRDPVEAWVNRQQNTPWSSGFSEDFRRGYDTAVEEVSAALALRASTGTLPGTGLDPWDRLGMVESSLNILISDGPFMDTLTSERGWHEPADPAAVRVYEAIIEASNAIDAYLAAATPRPPAADSEPA